MLAFLSIGAPEQVKHSLLERGLCAVNVPPFEKLAPQVASHVDMLFLKDYDTLFVHNDFDYSHSILFPYSFKNIIFISDPISSKYPNDALLNIAVVGNEVFANTKSASKTVLDYFECAGKTIHHVNQGYTHCATCIVNKYAIITADPSIAKAAEAAEITVLKITPGHISLPGYDYGFIGGASGYDAFHVYFGGSLDYHPDGKEIRKFCHYFGKEPVELYDGPLVDFGGIMLTT